MNPIINTYINALLADAAYVKDIPTGLLDATSFKDRLTTTQANYLATNFTVVASNQSANGGFDAVVWQIKAGSELAGPNNVNAGKLFVSMRGTQGPTDSADDITLASRGVPYDQIRDMVNWWLKNTAAVTNTEVKQIKVQETVVSIVPPITVKTFALDTPTTGTGLLNELDGIAGVNGHSLGGYLSTAFTRIFGGAWGVEQVSTFNSAGFSGAAGLKRDFVGDGARLLTGALLSPEVIARNNHPTLGKTGFLHETRRRTPCGAQDRPGARRRTCRVDSCGTEQTSIEEAT